MASLYRRLEDEHIRHFVHLYTWSI